MSGLLADLRTLDHAELLVVVFTSLGGIALSVAFFSADVSQVGSL